MLDVRHELVEHVAWLLYEQHHALNARWRRLGCFQQALLTLVHLRKNETFAQLGAGFGISESTAWRYVDEALDVLPSWAPGLQEALTGLGEGDHVIIDGTLIPSDRIKADKPYYSQKHKEARHEHAGHRASRRHTAVVLTGNAGRTHDLTAARAHGIVQACLTRQIFLLADRAYQGPGATVRTPYYGRDLPEKYQQYNRDHARLRAPGERAFARLESWRLLRRARCSTNRIGRTVAAVHTLLTCQYSG